MKKLYLLLLALFFVGCEDLIFPSTTQTLHPNFSAEYIQENTGTFKVEVPEVQELVHIIIAITPTGLSDRNMVDQTSPYYEEVLNQFSSFANEPIVITVNKILQGGSYARIKMDACGFYFEGDKILKNTTYDRLNWGLVNYLEPILEELEDFARKTEFRNFYQRYSAFYQECIGLLMEQAPLRTQWDWLENISEIRYDHYWITFSPLTGGSHSTNRFETYSFRQIAMFISGPIKESPYSIEVTSALMTRVLFTEIDHNYINPVSDLYTREISQALKNLSKWSGNSGYSSPLSAFNEYMTWALFTIYASEHLSEEDFAFVNELVETQMVNSRRFWKFSAFNKTLLELYRNQPVKSIEELYPDILEWCKQQ